MANRACLYRCCAVLLVSCLVSVVALAQDPWAQSYQLERVGQYDAALEALGPVLSADPGHELALLRSGWLRYLSGDYNASMRDYQRALERNDQSLEARLGLTLPLLAQSRWREAAATAQEVLMLAPWNYYAHLRLMVAEEGQRQWQTLAAHAAAVAARYPSDASFLVYLARAEARQGHTAAARSAYARVLERIPEHAEATAFLAASAD
jgi:tetratricopeptide (TPR) repeat protein